MTIADIRYPPFTGLPDGIAALDELKKSPRWVAWRYEQRKGPKPTKPPIDPHTGTYAYVDKPETWASYEEAAARAIQDGLPGVGYVLGDGDGDLTGIDIDGCAQAGKVTDKEVAPIVAFAGSYTEISPSGTGIRIFGRGKIESAITHKPAGVEIYGSGRYLTITGNCISHCKEIRATPHTIEALKKRIEKVKAEEATEEKGAPEEEEVKPRQGKRGAFWEACFGGQQQKSPFFRNVNDAALKNLDSWVPPLFGTDAKKSNLGYRVTSAALGRDREEDLSITPMGIKDFGEHDMGDARQGGRTAIDLVLDYGSAPDAVEAAHWLCERLGVTPESLGWGERKQEAPGQERKSPLHYFDDCETVVPKVWIFKGLIARGESSSWIAPPGKGKSALLAAVAVYAAAQKDFHGFRSKGACGVLYLAFERAGHTKRRMTAYARQGFKGLPIAIRSGIINLMHPDCVEIIVAAMKEAAERLGVEIGLVIIDTFAKGVSIGGGDENTAKDQGKALGHLQVIRDQTGCHTAIIHHTGKDVTRGARGSNAQVGDVDVEFTISGDKVRIVTVTKANDQPEVKVLTFTIKSESLGTDEDGDEITVGILADEEPLTADHEREWTGKTARLRDAINDVLIGDGGFDHHIPNGPTVKAVNLDDVRARYRQTVVAVNPDPKRPHKKADDALTNDIERASEAHLIGTVNSGQRRIVWAV